MRPIMALVCAVLLLIGSARAQERVDLVIAGGTIVTMDERLRVIEGGSLVVDGGNIVGVLGPDESPGPADDTIDASGHLVIPGLVNAHGHAAMTLLRGIADDLALLEWLENYIFPAESNNVSPEFVYIGTKLGCVEMARTGTTTYADMYYFEEEAARATAEVGIRGVLGQSVIGFPAPDYATPEQALAGASSFIEKYADHPLVMPSVAPHALYTTDLDIIKQAHAIARQHDVLFQIHAVEPPSENDDMIAKLGKRTIEALDDAGVLTEGVVLHHSIWLNDNDIARIARSGASASHNPESNMKTASGLSPVAELLAAGVPVGLGTDGAASNNNLDMFEEMDSAAKLHKLVLEDPTAMPAKTVFRLATMGSAEALGIADRVGSLEVGKLADIVLIDVRRPELTPLYDVYSHLVYAVKGAHVGTVLVGGNLVVENRQMVTVDETRIMAEANRMKQAIVESLEPR